MKRIKYFVLLSAIAVAAGCSDFLVREPNLAQSDKLTLNTFDGRDKATMGAYAYLEHLDWYGANFILANEMCTMNGKRWGPIIQRYESGRFADEYALNYTPGRTSPLWGVAYLTILCANNVIDAIGGSTEQSELNLKAECLFLRALSHFDLVRTYAMPYNFKANHDHLGVPVVLTSDSEAKPARETVAKVYEQIINDLLEAEKIIDPAYKREGVKDLRATVTLPVIQALLSRAYLYSEKWQEAADYATKVIESGKYTMWEPDKLVDAYAKDAPEDGEVIFEAYGNVTQNYSPANENVCGMTYFTGYGDCGASNDLKKLYSAGDARLALLSPDEEGRGLFTLKYAGKGQGEIDAVNTIILRLSEMYLIRAEASLQGAKGYSTVADLAAIASKRGAAPEPPTLDGVYKERAKEFAWEGHLWFDLARTGRDMTREDVSGTSIPVSLAKGNYRWARPISSRELSLNKALKQNEEYGQ